MSKLRLPETLPRSARIHSRKAFVRVFREGSRVADRLITLYGVSNGTDRCRLGISVSRRLGIAVKRNRLKRLIREVFRKVRHELPPGIDYVIIPKSGNEPTVSELRQSIRHLACKLKKRLTESNDN